MPRKKTRTRRAHGGRGKTSESDPGWESNSKRRKNDGVRDGIDNAVSTVHEDDWNDAFMDQSLWSQLPDDVIFLVLAYLQLVSFLRFRTVCKKWSSLIFSPDFIEMWSWRPQESYFINLMYCKPTQMLSIYNPVSDIWHSISMSFLPYLAGYPVASSGGLLCFIMSHTNSSESVCLLVCNPVTKSFRYLPPVPCNQNPMCVSMVADHSPFRYKVIMAGLLSSESFDSVTNYWRRVGSVPEMKVSSDFAFSNGNLYSLSCFDRSKILAFDLQQEVWSVVHTGRLPGQRSSRFLVGCKGSLFIVAKSVSNCCLSVCIWKFDQSTVKWKEIAKLSRSMSAQFLGKRSPDIYCTGHGDFIFFTRSNYCDKGLLYNLSTKSWSWVQNCQNLASEAVDLEPLLSVFEPRLDATA